MNLPAPETLFVIILFSAIGLAAFRHGKRQGQAACLLLGIALMVYPYFVEGLLLNLAVGTALTAATWHFWGS